jgi:hypothetical protein
MAEFFAGIGGFFSSAVGGIAVGAVFVWPAHCQRLVGGVFSGRWEDCDYPCTSIGALYPAVVRCENLFGGPCVNDDQMAGVIAGGLGLAFGLIAHVLAKRSLSS